MKIVRWIAVGLVGIIVLAVVVAFLLPRHVTVTRSVEIAAPADAVFALVSDLRRFNEWSPWFERDPDATYLFTGPTDGVGQTLRWESDRPEVGAGSMTVERLEPDTDVAIALDFAGQGAADTWFTVEPEGSATEVTWGFSTDLGFNPVDRYFGMMIDEAVGADYERGLVRLKTVAEAPPPPVEEE